MLTISMLFQSDSVESCVNWKPGKESRRVSREEVGWRWVGVTVFVVGMVMVVVVVVTVFMIAVRTSYYAICSCTFNQ